MWKPEVSHLGSGMSQIYLRSDELGEEMLIFSNLYPEQTEQSKLEFREYLIRAKLMCEALNEAELAHIPTIHARMPSSVVLRELATRISGFYERSLDNDGRVNSYLWFLAEQEMFEALCAEFRQDKALYLEFRARLHSITHDFDFQRTRFEHLAKSINRSLALDLEGNAPPRWKIEEVLQEEFGALFMHLLFEALILEEDGD